MEKGKNCLKFRYERACPEDFNVSVQFDVPSDMDIYDFHDFCKRFAAVLGFQQDNIEEVFGETTYT